MALAVCAHHPIRMSIRMPIRMLTAQSKRFGHQQIRQSFDLSRSLCSSMATNYKVPAAVASASMSSSSSASASTSKNTLPSPSSYPISGVVGIVKPSGATSMELLESLKPLLAASKVFRSVPSPSDAGGSRKKRKWRGGGGDASTPKIGQGGTLDPLADGVLVIGIGAGTKKLQQYLHCTKHYRTVGLLGASTISYDSQDPILERKPFAHVNADVIRGILPEFHGKQTQVPPLFSAVRIDGKRLMEYAREGLPLPRPIEGRPVEVHALTLSQWLPADAHTFTLPDRECSEEERKTAFQARQLAGLADASTTSEQGLNNGEQTADVTKSSDDAAAPAFMLDMTVSSGTYVRCIVHDVAAKANSAAHVVRLTRTRQGKWALPGFGEAEGKATAATVLQKSNGDAVDPEQEEPSERKEAVEWSVLQQAIDRLPQKKDAGRKRQKGGEHAEEDSTSTQEQPTESDDARPHTTDENGLEEWERIILERMDFC